MSCEFVHLHCHTEFSLSEGTIRIADLAARLQELGYTAAAMTDHGNLHGAVQFCKELSKKGIKPIIGQGFSIAHPESDELYALNLLCRNVQGYRNLIRLSSLSYRNRVADKPTLTHQLIANSDTAGLIALSGCRSSEVVCALLKKEYSKASQIAKFYQGIFGEFYALEVQVSGEPYEKKLNADILELGEGLGIAAVATNNCLYLSAQGAESQRILELMGAQEKRILGENEISTDQYYLKSPDEMRSTFADLPPSLLSHSGYLADCCQFQLTSSKPLLPKFPVGEGRSLNEELCHQSEEGLEQRLQTLQGIYSWDKTALAIARKAYADRLAFELEVITRMDYAGYFLIVADFVNWAKGNGVSVGPGRGSGAGSLVAYSLSITDLDPLHYDLLFERFLNPDRVSMPDFDIDFDPKGRERVIDYVKQKYGADQVCQISALGSLKPKGAVRGVARVLNISYSDADKIVKLIPNKINISFEEAFAESPELEQMLEEGTEQEQELLRIAVELEGCKTNLSTHAAGVIILNSPVDTIMPTCSGKTEDHQSQFTMEDAENQGAVKFDFLGLTNLATIEECLSLIRAHRPDTRIDMARIPLDDQLTFELLGKGRSIGVFQLESAGMRRLLIKSTPSRFEDIAALVALFRPGPMQFIDEFIARKHGRQRLEFAHPLLEQSLGETYGIMVYQEQVMRAAQILAGFSLGQADLLRRAMGKKKLEEIQQQRTTFVEGCQRVNQIAENTAHRIFDQIEKFAQYGFNKSHSVAYGLIGYQTAWLKANYPTEYMTALLNSALNDAEAIVKFVGECRELNIRVIPPDITRSAIECSVEGDAIRFGLGAIKNVGQKALEEVVKLNKKHKPSTVFECLQNADLSKLNSRALEHLFKCGAFDSLEPNRRKLFDNRELILETLASHQKNILPDVGSIFDMLESEQQSASEASLDLAECTDWSLQERLSFEREIYGFYISGHPLDEYQHDLRQWRRLQPNLVNVETIKDALQELEHAAENSGGTPAEQQHYGERREYWVAVTCQEEPLIRMTKELKKYASFCAEDSSGSIELIMFSAAFSHYGEGLEAGRELLVLVSVSSNQRGLSAQAKAVIGLPELRLASAVRLELGCSANLKRPQLAQLQRLCAEYDGSTADPSSTTPSIPLSIVICSGEVYQEVQLPGKTTLQPSFLSALENALPENYRFIYRQFSPEKLLASDTEG